MAERLKEQKAAKAEGFKLGVVSADECVYGTAVNERKHSGNEFAVVAQAEHSKHVGII